MLPPPESDEYAQALARLGRLSALPEERIAAVFAAAMKSVHVMAANDVAPMERAIMLAAEKLWAEEKGTLPERSTDIFGPPAK